jgi:hypothetical protein
MAILSDRGDYFNGSDGSVTTGCVTACCAFRRREESAPPTIGGVLALLG